MLGLAAVALSAFALFCDQVLVTLVKKSVIMMVEWTDEGESNNKSVQIELAPPVAQELRRRHHGKPTTANAHPKNSNDDWHHVLKEPGLDKLEHTVHDDDTASDASIASPDCWAGAPPPPASLPVVLVPFEPLVGYTPSTAMEAQQLQDMLLQQLLATTTSKASENENDDEEEEQQRRANVMMQIFATTPLARHADSRVVEQLQQHYQQSTLLSYAVLHYPSTIIGRDTTMGPATGMTRQQLWQRLWCRYGDLDVLNRLLQHVQDCNQSLLWKYDMHGELVRLARHEQAIMLAQRWQHARAHRLEQLYQVRATLQQQLSLAQQRQAQLEQEREQQVHHHVLATTATEGVSWHDDVGTSSFMADLLGHDDDDHLDDDQVPLMSDHDDCSQTSLANSSSNGSSSSSGTSSTEAVTDGDHPDNDGSSPHPAEHAATLVASAAAARAAQESSAHQPPMALVREQLTNPALQMAQTLATSLARKLLQVDNLLETMQDEEWQAEEEEEDADLDAERDDRGDQGDLNELAPAAIDISETRASMLDQILAMVLGRLPRPILSSLSSDEHRAWLVQEHAAIRQAWLETFGRLPPIASKHAGHQNGVSNVAASRHDVTEVWNHGAAQRQQAKQYLGIVDNDDGEWDDDDEDDDASDMDSAAAPRTEPLAKANTNMLQRPTRTGMLQGLRPGGRLL